MTCEDVRKLVYAYLDGEFSQDDRRELEDHMNRCVVCREQVEDERGFHAVLRRSLAGLSSEVPPELMERVDEALTEVVQEDLLTMRRRRRVAFGVGAVALVAGLALWLGLPRREAPGLSVVESVVQSHRRNLPIEVASSDPDSVRTWFQGKVDVPVRLPRPKKPTGRLLGGRVSHVRERDAAQLVYDVAGRKVSVLIFDPEGMRLDAPRRRLVRNREILIDGHRGYNVALFSERGLGYAVAGEADADELVEFVNAALAP